MNDTLDPDYAASAARRAAGAPAPRRSAQALVFTALVLIGVLVSVSVWQARRGQPVAERQRDRLIDEIHDRTARTDQLQREFVALREQAAQAQAAELDKSISGQSARQRLVRLEFAAAVTPVEGPGLEVEVDDAPPGSAGMSSPGGFDASRVLDRDLQELVNGLWASGAEAVAVNGQRVTALTAIRSAGGAILVDYRPISPPYTVMAIGDPDGLEAAFADSAAGRQFHTLQSTFGIRFEMRPRGQMRLPGASGLPLRYATEVGRK